MAVGDLKRLCSALRLFMMSESIRFGSEKRRGKITICVPLWLKLYRRQTRRLQKCMEKGEPMAEYIEREAALSVIRKLNTPAKSPAQKDMLRTASVYIQEIPAADVAPVVYGRWNRPFLSGTKRKNPFCYCTNCAYPVQPKRMSNYCPGCGAKMDLEV